MDMRQLAFSIKFETILIPYNTLNLLTNKADILTCLRGCATPLKPGGRIYLHLYVPDDKVTSKIGKTFQFQIFERSDGGKIIKEVLKEYSAQTRTMNIEERYRIRPVQQGSDNGYYPKNTDYSHSFTISSLSYEEWEELFSEADLRIIHTYGGYDLSPFQRNASTRLLAILGK